MKTLVKGFMWYLIVTIDNLELDLVYLFFIIIYLFLIF